MRELRIAQLFGQLVNATQIKDVGFHKIEDGKLVPVSKTQTDNLLLERWKGVHAANPVYVEENLILREIMQSKESIFISDVVNDERSSKEFFFFGIQSILIIPVVRKKNVGGIVVIASLDKLHHFTEDEIVKCENIVKKYFLEEGSEHV